MTRITPLQLLIQACNSLRIYIRRDYLPPLMIYFSSGLLALTSIAGMFFTKGYLNLSAAFFAELTFWTSLPWTLKIAFGHLTDLFWKQKGVIISVGAALVSINLLIMFGLVQHTSDMVTVLSVEAWYIVGTLLASVGYVLQDVVADAMTVDAVPTVDDEGNPLDETTIKAEHVTLQSLARFVLIGAAALVAAINMTVFQGGNSLSETHTHRLYADIYLYALMSPLISMCAVILTKYLARAKAQVSSRQNPDHKDRSPPPKTLTVNWNIFLASALLIVFAAVLTALKIPFSQETLFLGLAFFILFLMRRVMASLPKDQKLMMIGMAILVFIPGATPHPGPSPSWFSIDQLLFDEQFFSYLFFLSTLMALVGIVVLRPLLIKNSIARVMVLLAIVTTVLSLPNIGMYYGLHHWTSSVTGGLVDARFITLIDAAALSLFTYLIMLPLLAWVAQNAPPETKATFFALFASFASLSGLASSLGAKYLNQVFVVTREVRDKVTGNILTEADYSELGLLMITVVVVAFVTKVGTVVAVQNSRFCIRAASA